MSWQLKGWLLLTSALVATALVASTAGAGLTPISATAAQALPSITARTPTTLHPPQVVLRMPTVASIRYGG